LATLSDQANGLPRGLEVVIAVRPLQRDNLAGDGWSQWRGASAPRFGEGLLKRLALKLVLVLLLLVGASATYNALCIWLLQRRHPVPGKIYQVEGSAMHLYCTGSGSPTVLLESGRGNGWLYWQRVQPALAGATRVCSYDRAGIGWSDPQEGPRDAVHIAAQLHQLLQQANEVGPLVMVGASAGGFYVRQFTARYPAEVVGLALVDASIPEQVEALPDAKDSEAKRRERHRTVWWQWLKDASGWERLAGNCNGDVERGLEAYAALSRALACRPSLETGSLGEWDGFWLSGEEAREAGCCGDLPLLIVSQDPDRPKPGWTQQQIAAQPLWNRLQENLKSLSPRSRRIIARSSGHHVMIDRPDVVIGGVQQLVHDVRDRIADPAFGTTVVQ
jgi:pimeloyl-ACP methyl ester carboxylesterase